MKKIKNTIRDHLKKDDFKGVKKQRNGESLRHRFKPRDYDHIGEMKDSLHSLRTQLNILKKSLRNPAFKLVGENLDKVRKTIEETKKMIKEIKKALGRKHSKRRKKPKRKKDK